MSCTCCVKSLADYVVAWTPVVISAVVAVIAWAQYSTNRKKLRLDLYDRRFSVYEMTLNYYLVYIGKGKTETSTSDVEMSFIRAYRESMFLFGPTSKTYSTLTQFKDSMASRVEYSRKLKEEHTDPEVLEAFDQLIKSQPDPEELLKRLEFEVFPYLAFYNIERGKRQ